MPWYTQHILYKVEKLPMFLLFFHIHWCKIRENEGSNKISFSITFKHIKLENNGLP